MKLKSHLCILWILVCPKWFIYTLFKSRFCGENEWYLFLLPKSYCWGFIFNLFFLNTRLWESEHCHWTIIFRMVSSGKKFTIKILCFFHLGMIKQFIRYYNIELCIPVNLQATTENPSLSTLLDFILNIKKKKCIFFIPSLASLYLFEQWLRLGVTSTSSVWLPRQDESLYVFPNCKLLWIKASAKWLNVNVNSQVCVYLLFKMGNSFYQNLKSKLSIL